MSFFQKLGSFLAITAAVVVGLAVTNWGTINKYRVQVDLRDFGRSVRKSTLSLPEKERLLDVIERLDDKADDGEQFDWLTWSRHAETVREIVHGKLDSEKVRLIERELLRSRETSFGWRLKIVKKQPYSFLGYHLQLRREQRLLRRRKLARIIGFADGKIGAKSIRLLEEFGTIDPPDLLTRVAVVLHIDDSTIQKLQEKDRQAAGDWLRKD